MTFFKNERKAWYMYDWAISAFTTTVLAVFIGPYLTTIAKSAAINGRIDVFGLSIYADSYYNYIISLSVFLQVIILPGIGAIADLSGYRKLFFSIFTFTGAIAAMMLYFLDGNNYLFGGLMLIIANLSCGSAMVTYNAYLQEISAEEERNQVSSNGFAIGYVGGGLLLVLNLILVTMCEKFGLTTGQAVRISLFSAGFWWLIFGLIPIIVLKSGKIDTKFNFKIVKISFKNMIKTIKDLKHYPKAALFLLAYLLYNDGVQSVIVVSAQFGQEALKLSISTLTTVILIVQFVAFFGAKLFAYLADKFNAKNALIISLIIWIGLLFYSYQFLSSELGFYIIGACIGMVLGGTQAISRSIYSLVIPIGKEAEYFSIYELSERGTSWLGPLIFAISLDYTHNYKFAILSLSLFFVLGLILLLKFNLRQGILDSGNTLPLSLK